MKKKIIFGDSVIRTEIYSKLGSGTVPRMLSEAEQVIVDMNKQEKTAWQKAKVLNPISSELQKMIDDAHKKNEHTILFINRKGYEPTTVCNDCFKTILCEKCDAPLVLHKSGNKTKFVCHKCLEETIALERCPYCKSWQLKTLGWGIQKVEEEIKNLFPGTRVFRMDGDSIKTQKQGEKVADEFLSSAGSVLIGTEILFSYIKQPVDCIGVVSVDAMFALPDFKINEKIFRLLLKLRSLAKVIFLVQTRLPDQELFGNVLRGNLSGFYKSELEMRGQFKYPPFKMLIKVSKTGKDRASLKKEIDKLEKVLEEWKPFAYPAFTGKVKGNYIYHILFKVDPSDWPPNRPEKFYDILSSLSPAWKIDVEPESLL